MGLISKWHADVNRLLGMMVRPLPGMAAARGIERRVTEFVVQDDEDGEDQAFAIHEGDVIDEEPGLVVNVRWVIVGGLPEPVALVQHRVHLVEWCLDEIQAVKAAKKRRVSRA